MKFYTGGGRVVYCNPLKKLKYGKKNQAKITGTLREEQCTL
jgi:hypothetical protein